MKKDNIEQDLDLTSQPPKAGEVRSFPLGEARFMSPKPLPTARIEPGSWGESNQVLAVNDVYMDIGQGNQGKAFQVQMVQGIINFGFLVVLGILFFAAYADGIKYEIEGQFWHFFWQELSGDGLIGFALFALCGSPGWYVIFQSSLKKARQRPLRFNRQRREVCYYPENSDTPVIAPWEEVVSWVALHRGSTGSGLAMNFTFGLAVPTEDGQDYWVLRKPVPIVQEGQRLWEIIRCYMDEDEAYWAIPAKPESRKTFEQNRRALHSDFNRGPKRWLKISTMCPWVSYLSMAGYYFTHMLCCWKLPYLIAEWDSKISMAKFPEDVEQWSQPLPLEQWAKPSEALLEQKKALEKFMAAGGSAVEYFEQQKASASQ